MSQVRFQADGNLNHIIVQAAQRREPTLDFQTAHTASLLGVSDSDALGRATREGRLLVTHDFHDMPQHFAAFIQDQMSAGVLLVPQPLPVAAVVEDLLLIWAATEAEDWHNCITSLPLLRSGGQRELIAHADGRVGTTDTGTPSSPHPAPATIPSANFCR